MAPQLLLRPLAFCGGSGVSPREARRLNLHYFAKMRLGQLYANHETDNLDNSTVVHQDMLLMNCYPGY